MAKIRPEQLSTAAAITALLKAADVAAARTALGIGTLATKSTVSTTEFSVATACENLTYNGSFEVDSNGDGVADGWSGGAYSFTAGTFVPTVVTSALDLGGKAQRMDCQFPAGSGYCELRSTTANRSRLFAGQVVSLSAWVRGATTNRAIIYLEFYDAGGGIVGVIGTTGTYMADAAQQLKVRGTVPATAKSGAVILRVLAESGAATTAWAEFDMAMAAHSDTFPSYADNAMQNINLHADVRTLLAGKAVVGGRNLLANGSFERGMTGWSNVSGLTSLAVSTTQALVGSQSLKLVSAGDAAYAQATVAARPSTTYTFSAWLYVESITGGAFSGRDVLVQDAADLSNYVAGSSLVTTHAVGVWSRKVVGFTTTAACTTLNLRLYCPVGTVYWDCVQVEEGDVPTAWRPHPSEVTDPVLSNTPQLINLKAAADDAAAATAGVPVGGMYQAAGVLRVRLT